MSVCDDAAAHPPDGGWLLYVLECASATESSVLWYAGITNDLPKRVRAHVTGKGARFTRSRPPIRLVGVRRYADRSAASRAEWEIRQCRSRLGKLNFLQLKEA